jgi:hypothetical protein
MGETACDFPELSGPTAPGSKTRYRRLVEQGERHPIFQETRAVSWKFHPMQRIRESAQPLAFSLVMATRRVSTFSGRRWLTRPGLFHPAHTLSIKLCHTSWTHADPPPSERGESGANFV